MKSLFLGIYWGPREEQRAECAARLSRFLEAGTRIDSTLERWFLKAMRKRDAISPVDISPAGIEARLETNRRDTTGETIAELGFSLDIWNGESASLSANLGAFSPYVSNAVVVSFSGDSPSRSSVWQELMERAVEAFDPDSAVVTNHEYLDLYGDAAPDEAGGWFVYRRGQSIVEHAFPGSPQL